MAHIWICLLCQREQCRDSQARGNKIKLFTEKMSLLLTCERNVSAANSSDKLGVVFILDKGGEVVQSLTTYDMERKAFHS